MHGAKPSIKVNWDTINESTFYLKKWLSLKGVFAKKREKIVKNNTYRRNSESSNI